MAGLPGKGWQRLAPAVYTKWKWPGNLRYQTCARAKARIIFYNFDWSSDSDNHQRPDQSNCSMGSCGTDALLHQCLKQSELYCSGSHAPTR